MHLALLLGHTAGAEILERDVWRALNSQPPQRPNTLASFWGSETQPEPRSWRETSGEHEIPNLPSGRLCREWHIKSCSQRCGVVIV